MNNLDEILQRPCDRMTGYVGKEKDICKLYKCKSCDIAKADIRKMLLEKLPNILTPETEPPMNKLSQNQIFGAGQMNMLMRVRDMLEGL